MWYDDPFLPSDDKSLMTSCVHTCHDSERKGVRKRERAAHVDVASYYRQRLPNATLYETIKTAHGAYMKQMGSVCLFGHI